MVVVYSIVFETITNRVTDFTINDDTENINSSSRNIRINWLNAVHVSAWHANLTPPHPGSPRLHPFSPRVGGGELSVVLCSIADAALAFTLFLGARDKKPQTQRNTFKKKTQKKNYKWSACLRNLMTCCNFDEKSVIVFTDTYSTIFMICRLCLGGVINECIRYTCNLTIISM